MIQATYLEEKPSIFILPGIISGAYLFCTLVSNILTVKLINVPILNWAIDGGKILYPLTFIVRDMLHKSLGRKYVDATVIASGVFSLIMAIVIKFAVLLPPFPDWEQYQIAFDQTLSSTWRIALGSVISQIIANLINSKIFSVLYKKFLKKEIFVSLTSNVVAVLVDTLIFCTIAFWGWDYFVIFQIVVMNLVFKFLTLVLFSPVIKFVRRRVKIEKI